jgi:hypothetical protein
VKPNDFGAIFGIKKVALNGIFDHVAQLIEGIGFGSNAITDGRCNVASVDQVLSDFENYFHVREYHSSPACLKLKNAGFGSPLRLGQFNS